MTENTPSTKRKPDFIAHAVHSANGGTKYTRIGVAFNHKNGGIGVMYDAIPLSGQIVLLGIDQEEKPAAISYGHPSRKPSFEANMVRESGNDSYWTEVGSAWRMEGYISIQLQVVPNGGKIILTQPKERE